MTKVLAEVTGSISFSQRGEKGQKGAIMREHDGFESGIYKYLSGAGEEAYIDVVCIEGKWYQCTKTYDNATSSPSLTDGHWTKMSQYKSIATHLLLAENATINMLGSNQINLYNPSGGAMFGSFRVVSNDNDYALWLGAPNGADAPFSVKRSGSAKMTDADITGKITATSGKIGGLNITENGLGIGVYGQFDLRIGTALEHSSFWNGYYNNGYGEVCVGKAALINPFTDYWQTACDMYGDRASGQTGSSNVNNATMIVRKITKGSNKGSTVSAVNNVFDPAYAALNVDTDEGIGIRSIGGNLLGCIAQNVIRTDSVTQKEQTAIDNNRVGILVMVNSSEVNVKLPKTPMVGQMLIVVQGNSRIYFDPVVSGRRLYCCGKIHTTSDKFYSDDVGQFNILIWDGYYWQLQYIYH